MPAAARSVSVTIAGWLGLDAANEQPHRRLEGGAGVVLGLPRRLGGGLRGDVGRIRRRPRRLERGRHRQVARDQPISSRVRPHHAHEIGLPGVEGGIGLGNVVGHGENSLSIAVRYVKTGT